MPPPPPFPPISAQENNQILNNYQLRVKCFVALQYTQKQTRLHLWNSTALTIIVLLILFIYINRHILLECLIDKFKDYCYALKVLFSNTQKKNITRDFKRI